MSTSKNRFASRHFTAADALILLNGLSTFGSGLVYPYTVLYLSGLPEIGTAGVSVFYGAAAAANLATAAVLATGWLKPPPALLGLVGTLMLAVGFLGTATAGSLLFLSVAVAFIGCGQGCLLVAMVPVLNSLVPAEERRSVFARRYRAINVGLGLGAVVAGLTTGFFALSAVPWLFVCNALSYLPLAYAFHRIRGRERTVAAAATRKDADDPLGTARPTGAADPADAAGPVGSTKVPEETKLKAGSAVGRWKWLGATGALAVVFQLGAYLFGHSQFEATAPLVAVELMGIGLGAVSGLLLVNTAVVAFGQKWVTRRLSSRTEAYGLRVTVILWALAYVVVACSAFGPDPVRYTGLALFAVVFAIGECAYSCSYHPWLISSVHERDVTRVAALAGGAMGIGTAAGPSIGVALTLSGSATTVWLSLASFCLLMLLTVGGRCRTAAGEAAHETPTKTLASHTGERND
ncbi:MFS transporter [Streptomyces sp. NPDC005065]|uniref:MFS transporter n=1 Tax=unclassified Streptomyces TaxID=2593676 RepID=UPI0033B34C2B